LFNVIKRSPYGRVLKAMRRDEQAVKALGRNTVMFKVQTFFLSAACSGLAGLIYASYVSYIDPTSFTLDESIFIITALFIGGIGNIKGPILGALFVVILPELLRFVGMPDAIAANMRQIIYGLALVIIMFVRPQGLFGEKATK
jgi:branched-chain amino acid transport system permease protein